MKCKIINQTILPIFIALLVQFLLTSCSSVSENVKSQGDINYIIESVSGQIETYVCTGKGPIATGSRGFTELKLSEATWDNYSKTLKVYVNENFNLKAVFEFDTVRKIWVIKDEEIAISEDTTIDKEKYISDVDFDRYGYLREYNFRMIKITSVDSEKEGTVVTGYRTKIRIVFKKAE